MRDNLLSPLLLLCFMIPLVHQALPFAIAPPAASAASSFVPSSSAIAALPPYLPRSSPSPSSSSMAIPLSTSAVAGTASAGVLSASHYAVPPLPYEQQAAAGALTTRGPSPTLFAGAGTSTGAGVGYPGASSLASGGAASGVASTVLPAATFVSGATSALAPTKSLFDAAGVATLPPARQASPQAPVGGTLPGATASFADRASYSQACSRTPAALPGDSSSFR